MNEKKVLYFVREFPFQLDGIPSRSAFIVEKCIHFQSLCILGGVLAMLPPPPHNKIFIMGNFCPFFGGGVDFCWVGTLPT